MPALDLVLWPLTGNISLCLCALKQFISLKILAHLFLFLLIFSLLRKKKEKILLKNSKNRKLKLPKKKGKAKPKRAQKKEDFQKPKPLTDCKANRNSLNESKDFLPKVNKQLKKKVQQKAQKILYQFY